jgi:hypothetical protein
LMSCSDRARFFALPLAACLSSFFLFMILQNCAAKMGCSVEKTDRSPKSGKRESWVGDDSASHGGVRLRNSPTLRLWVFHLSTIMTSFFRIPRHKQLHEPNCQSPQLNESLGSEDADSVPIASAMLVMLPGPLRAFLQNIQK